MPDERYTHQYLVSASKIFAQDVPCVHIRGQIEQAVSSVFSVPVSELRASTRRHARAAFARQVAMYLAHVVFGISLTCVGKMFSRDRTTVAHGCSVVEDRRDEPAIDRALTIIELVLQKPSFAAEGGRC